MKGISTCCLLTLSTVALKSLISRHVCERQLLGVQHKTRHLDEFDPPANTKSRSRISGQKFPPHSTLTPEFDSSASESPHFGCDIILLRYPNLSLVICPGIPALDLTSPSIISETICLNYAMYIHYSVCSLFIINWNE